MSKKPPVTEESRLQLGVEGMSCGSCAAHVHKALEEVSGVASVSVNLATEEADIELAPEADRNAVLAQLGAAVSAAGYGISKEGHELDVSGMSCASCVGHVEQALRGVPGVVDAKVNLAAESAHVTVERGVTSPEWLVQAVKDAGYQAELPQQQVSGDTVSLRREQEALELGRALRWALLLTAPVFLIEMGSHLVPVIHHWVHRNLGRDASWQLQFVLTTLVLFWPGRRFFQKGVTALFRFAPDMNSLVVVGTGSAYLYSLVATFLPELLPPGTRNVYYEPAAVIVTLILLGKSLEIRAKGRTSQAITRLLDLQVKRALRVWQEPLTAGAPSGEPDLAVLKQATGTEVDIGALRVGDVVSVRPGERIATDGEVIEGSSYVDESAITGEAIPVSKKRGDAVVGGTINKTGAFLLRVDRVGEETVLAQVIGMVREAQGSKLPIQTLVDRVTLVFVPAVMAAALLTFAVWWALGPEPALTLALVNAVSVLIIACPCAMGLATPTSILVGTGRAAELGVFFRRGEALQVLRDVQVVAMDKTGTLTEGQPEVTDVSCREKDKTRLLALAAALERRSEHPLAGAIVRAAVGVGTASLAADSFEATVGMGAEGQVDGHSVAIGAERFMKTLGIDFGEFSADAQRLAQGGQTAVYLAVDGAPAALFGVADPVKTSTPSALRWLKQQGLRLVMLTGDGRHTAQAIAARLELDEVKSELLPAGKVEALRRLQDRYGKVAFVGDGINDAPALAAADVGVAIGNGTDVAIESAEVVLLGGDLRGTVSALAVSRQTIRNIRQNLFWAFAYNVALIPVAAGALYPVTGTLLSPMLAAVSMALSSVFVLGNALRLRSYRPPVLSD